VRPTQNIRFNEHPDSIPFPLFYLKPPFNPKSIELLTHRGATTAEKLRGTKVWVPTKRLALCQRPGWVLGAGWGRLFPL